MVPESIFRTVDEVSRKGKKAFDWKEAPPWRAPSGKSLKSGVSRLSEMTFSEHSLLLSYT